MKYIVTLSATHLHLKTHPEVSIALDSASSIEKNIDYFKDEIVKFIILQSVKGETVDPSFEELSDRDFYIDIPIGVCVSSKIRALRDGKTQQQLANMIGCSKSNYQKLEHIHANHCLQTLEKIAEAHGKRLSIEFK